jgi:hypothetical protein
MRPPSSVDFVGSRRMMALAIIDLPEPDSPTTQRISAATPARRRQRVRAVGAFGQRDAQASMVRIGLSALIGFSASG